MPEYTPEGWPAVEDGLYGDQELFLEALECGHFNKRYTKLERDNACADETRIKQWMTSLNHNAPPATQFLPC